MSSSSADFPPPRGQEPLAAIGHDVYRLRRAIHDPTGRVAILRPLVQQYAAATKDGELREVLSLCLPTIHVNSFWGVTRGLPAFAVLLQQERESLAIAWHGPFKPVNNSTFVRTGTCTFDAKSSTVFQRMPVFGSFFQRRRTEEVKESIVFDDSNRILCRSLALGWYLAPE